MLYDANKMPAVIPIGRQTENKVCEIAFDFAAWVEQFPGMTAAILHTRPGEDAAYIVESETDGAVIKWNVNAADTAIAGFGTVELLGLVDDKRKLSAWAKTHIAQSRSATTQEPPEAATPWVDSVLEAAQKVEDATVHPPIIGENGNWQLWDFDAGAYVDSGVSAQGKDGYTPVRGTDYYTDEDKAEMVTAVIAALTDAAEVGF